MMILIKQDNNSNKQNLIVKKKKKIYKWIKKIINKIKMVNYNKKFYILKLDQNQKIPKKNKKQINK